MAIALICSIASIQSCRKPSIEKDKIKLSGSGTTVPSYYSNVAQKRNLSPYSIKVVRKVRQTLNELEVSEANIAGAKPLNANNYQLYYSIIPHDNQGWSGLEDWLQADSTREALPLPLDSISLYPHIFTDEVIESYMENPQKVYTVLRAGETLPSTVNATLLDTLYVPDSTEFVLDFSLNLMTGNLSYSFIQEMRKRSTTTAGYIEAAYQDDQILLKGRSGGGDPGAGDFPHNGSGFEYLEHYNPIYDQAFTIEFGEPIGPRIPAPRDGRVTYMENTLNVREGIKRLRLRFVRFTFFGPALGWTWTDDNGNYTIGNYPNWGEGILESKFQNDKVKIKPLSTNNVGNVIGSILQMPFPAKHIKQIDLWQSSNGINIDHPHVSQYALWGIIMNGVADANRYAVDLGIRGDVELSPYLCVLAIYTDEYKFSSTPMLGYTGSSVNGLSWIYNILGLTGVSLPGTVIEVPDMIINQNTDAPVSSAGLRQTIFHEYGHSLHYFKTGSQFWVQNIQNSATAGDNYGEDINLPDGDFFALSEGWADYIGHLFSSIHYGNLIVRDRTESTDETAVLYDQNNTYLFHLENNPTYFNSFIPRGLFYDLTDGDTPAEQFFDRINGFTTSNVYQALSPTIITIQDFRAKWENDHPDPNNSLLFDFYNVN